MAIQCPHCGSYKIKNPGRDLVVLSIGVLPLFLCWTAPWLFISDGYLTPILIGIAPLLIPLYGIIRGGRMIMLKARQCKNCGYTWYLSLESK